MWACALEVGQAGQPFGRVQGSLGPQQEFRVFYILMHLQIQMELSECSKENIPVALNRGSLSRDAETVSRASWWWGALLNLGDRALWGQLAP